jgi:hypothetical protein
VSARVVCAETGKGKQRHKDKTRIKYARLFIFFINGKINTKMGGDRPEFELWAATPR